MKLEEVEHFEWIGFAGRAKDVVFFILDARGYRGMASEDGCGEIGSECKRERSRDEEELIAKN